MLTICILYCIFYYSIKTSKTKTKTKTLCGHLPKIYDLKQEGFSTYNFCCITKSCSTPWAHLSMLAYSSSFGKKPERTNGF